VSAAYMMYVEPRSFSLLPSSSICSGLSVLGVWERRWWSVLKVAPSSGHGRPRWSVVRSGVSHLPLSHLHQPSGVLLVWRGCHLQPLPDEPETNQGHPQQSADQSHVPHTGTVQVKGTTLSPSSPCRCRTGASNSSSPWATSASAS